MLKWIMDQPPILIMIIIFLKNLLASAMAMLLGLGLGLVPLMVVTSNGFLPGHRGLWRRPEGGMALSGGRNPAPRHHRASCGPGQHRHRLSAGLSAGSDHLVERRLTFPARSGLQFISCCAGLHRCSSWPRQLKLLSPQLLYRWLHDRFQDKSKSKSTTGSRPGPRRIQDRFQG